MQLIKREGAQCQLQAQRRHTETHTVRHTHWHTLGVTIDKPQRQQLRQLPLADPLPLCQHFLDPHNKQRKDEDE